jgi:hypothetical protein
MHKLQRKRHPTSRVVTPESSPNSYRHCASARDLSRPQSEDAFEDHSSIIQPATFHILHGTCSRPNGMHPNLACPRNSNKDYYYVENTPGSIVPHFHVAVAPLWAALCELAEFKGCMHPSCDPLSLPNGRDFAPSIILVASEGAVG